MFSSRVVIFGVVFVLLGSGDISFATQNVVDPLTTDPSTPLLEVDEDAARSLIDREADSPEFDSSLVVGRLKEAALTHPRDRGIWADYGDVLAEQSLDRLRTGDVEGAWRSIEQGKRAQFLRWSGVDLDPVSLEDLQIWLGGAEASLLVYSDSERLPVVAFFIDSDEIVAYELVGQGRPETKDRAGATSVEIQARALASSLFNAELAKRVVSATRLFVVPPYGESSIPFSAVVDLLATEGPGSPELAVGKGPPLSLLPAASFLSGRISPRMRSGSGLTVFSPHLENAQQFALRKDRVWLGDEARWGRFGDKDTRDSDVLHFEVPLLARDAWEPVGLGTPFEFASPDTIVPQLAFDWSSAFQIQARDPVARRSFVLRFLSRRSRSFGINAQSISPEVAEEAGVLLFENLRSGLARDEAMRATRRELRTRGRSLEDVYALQIWGAGNLPVYALVPPRGIGGLLIAWAFFLISGFWIVSFLGRRLSPSRPSLEDDSPS